MSDLISREALMRKMLDPIYTWEDYDEMENLVSYLPAVDAVEVVRCKDCKHWDEKGLFCHHPAGMCFGGKTAAVKGFCYFGERREENAAD